VVGVLALQGDYEAHARALRSAGAEVKEVRTAPELETVVALVIPGGESTTMLNLLHRERLVEPLKRFSTVRPIFGTCAGAILLASDVTNPVQECLGVVDIGVERNAYGRQLDSRVVRLDAGELGEVEAVFIRAPIIRRTGEGVKVIANYNGDPVLVEQGMHMVATFHPELSMGTRVHGRFLEKVKG